MVGRCALDFAGEQQRVGGQFHWTRSLAGPEERPWLKNAAPQGVAGADGTESHDRLPSRMWTGLRHQAGHEGCDIDAVAYFSRCTSSMAAPS